MKESPVGKKNNIIQINGKRYDASSGRPLDGHSAATPPPAARSVDGVLASGTPVHPAQPAAKPVSTIKPTTLAKPAPAPSKPSPADSRRPTKPAASHRPQRSRTLVRQAVQKPTLNPKRHRAAHGHLTALTPKPQSALQIKQSAQALDAKRLQHAKRIAKSQAISRFGSGSGSASDKSAATSLPVAATPALASPAPQLKPQPRPAGAIRIAPPKPAAPKQARAQTTADLLDHAVQRATSHLQPAPPRPRRFGHRQKRISSVSGFFD